MVTHTFPVEHIHCGSCESAVSKALTRLDGVRDVAADSTTNHVTVRYDESRTSTDTIAERLATAGYPVIS